MQAPVFTERMSSWGAEKVTKLSIGNRMWNGWSASSMTLSHIKFVPENQLVIYRALGSAAAVKNGKVPLSAITGSNPLINTTGINSKGSSTSAGCACNTSGLLLASLNYSGVPMVVNMGSNNLICSWAYSGGIATVLIAPVAWGLPGCICLF